MQVSCQCRHLEQKPTLTQTSHLRGRRWPDGAARLQRNRCTNGALIGCEMCNVRRLCNGVGRCANAAATRCRRAGSRFRLDSALGVGPGSRLAHLVSRLH